MQSTHSRTLRMPLKTEEIIKQEEEQASENPEGDRMRVSHATRKRGSSAKAVKSEAGETGGSTDIKLCKDEPGDEEEEEFHWWENEDEILHEDGLRWKTLSHQGVYFAPPYQPHRIPTLYEGRVFQLTPEEEEIATMFAVLRNSDYYKNEVFRANFFAAWKEILDRRPEGKTIRRLEYCNFDEIWNWHQQEREARLALPREEKKRRRDELAQQVEPYRYCTWDGRKEPVANFRVEPPGLFRGRGKHPLQGSLKRRIEAEDITLNLSEDAVIPDPPPGHKWREVVHRPEAMWLCMWKDTVTGNFKYVMPGVSSSIKGLLDKQKFEKARKLKLVIDSIRASYMGDLRQNENIPMLQRATAMYFIDRLALRVGNEKGEDEADTVGCCSLRCEHLTLKDPNHITFDFLGKDSVRYFNTVEVEPSVFTIVRLLLKGKKGDDEIFDQVSPTQLNAHLKSFMPGLSAKVFRTYNASICLQNHFFEHPVDPSWTVPDKMAYFTEANTKVAILCNHQKGVSKNHSHQVVQLEEKLKQLMNLQERILIAKRIAETGSAHDPDLKQPQESVTKKQKGKSTKGTAPEDGQKELINTAENWAAARNFWIGEEDRIQWAWLEEFGTEEEKEQYRTLQQSQVDSQKIACPKLRKRSRSENGNCDASVSTSSARSKSMSAVSKSRRGQKKRMAEESHDDDDDDDDDLTIGALWNKKKVEDAAKELNQAAHGSP